MMKTLAKIITSVILALFFPFVIQAQSTTILYDFKYDGLCFRKVSESSVAICPESKTETSDGQVVYQGNYNDGYYTPELPTYVYDEDFNYYSVIAIDPHAFENTHIKAIRIPGSYNSIGEYAFKGCDELEYVVIGEQTEDSPYSDITLEARAFYNTTNLKSIFLNGKYDQNIILANQNGSDAFSTESQVRSDFKIFAVQPSSYTLSTWSNYIIYKYGTFAKCSLVYNGETQIPTPVYNSEVEVFQATVGQCDVGGPDESRNVGSYNGIAYISFLAGYPYYLQFTISQEYNYSITPASLTISTPNLFREYGQPNPEIEISITGYVGNDNEAIFSTRPMVVNGMDSQWPALPDETSNVGEYPIYVMADQHYPQNYELHYDNGSITVEKASQAITWDQEFEDIFVGNETELTATSTSGLSVSYTSSDLDIAMVEGNIVKFIDSGEVSITAFQNGNDNYNAAEHITKTVMVNISIDNGLTLNVSETNLKPEESLQLIIEDYEWTSSDEKIATVSESGLVTAIAGGEVVITLSRKSDETTLATCKIKVDYNSATSELSIKKGVEIGCYGNEVIIKGASASSTVYIYDMNGHTVYQGLDRSIHLDSGIYIVSIEGSQLKVIIK